MARDDALDKEFDQLEQEIEAKVDSLFVEVDAEGDEGLSVEEDPWKGLKEHFLTLEWEIDRSVLEKIGQEVRTLKTRFPDGPIHTLLGWMGQVADKIRDEGAEASQDIVAVLHETKEGLLKLGGDPFQDPDPILIPLRERVEKVLRGEEEAPTITLEALGRGDELLFEDLDRTVEEVLQEEGEPLTEAEETVQEGAGAPPLGILDTGAGEAEFGWTDEEEPAAIAPAATARAASAGVEAPAASPPPAAATAAEPADMGAEPGDLDRIKEGLAAAGREIQGLLDGLQGPSDPLGITRALELVQQGVQSFSSSLTQMVFGLQEQIRALASLDLAPKLPDPVVLPEPPRQEILFVSVSNRIFGIPLDAVQGIFRVPSKAVPHVVQMNEVGLRGDTVPLISLWKKLGLGRALYTFPKEEKRVLLVHAGTGPVALLVDQVLARQSVALKPMEGEVRPLFKGLVTVEKNAFVVDVDAL
jgi:chemotaxis protein histidine kinase CheA